MYKFFFGAGRVGKQILDMCSVFEILPDYFIDNEAERWGQEHCGIEIVSLEKACSYDDITVYITCKDSESVKQQLLTAGVEDKRIWYGRDWLNIFLWVCHLSAEDWGVVLNDRMSDNKEKSIVFDLFNGLVLGGVETWSLRMAEKLQMRGHRVKVLTNDVQEHSVDPRDIPIIELSYASAGSEREKMAMCVQAIRECGPCTIVGNFPERAFGAACIAKKTYPEMIRLVAVIHNDEQIYYDMYAGMADLLDACIVISSRMRVNLCRKGFPVEKIHMLQWEIPIKSLFAHTYSRQTETLRLGYAGRVVVWQKRMDLMLQAAQKLKQMGCDFKLEIAGAGDYEEEMKLQIQQMDLQDCVVMLGYIDRDKIADFWQRQDIMLSCSDYEGHSISQAEAMAEGAVPIITDVSGARDDVTDGENGYVVPVGAIDTLVSRIAYLYHDRDMLAQLGKNAYETIKSRKDSAEQFECIIKAIA